MIDEIVVDDQDRHFLTAYRWGIVRMGKAFYAHARSGGRTIYLHRLIMGEPPGLEIDHRDGDGLNNRRSNLRATTHRFNLANQRLSSASTTGYKGVSLNSRAARRGVPKWVAQTKYCGERLHIGTYTTPEAAARAYDVKVRDLYGEFARTNADLGLLSAEK